MQWLRFKSFDVSHITSNHVELKRKVAVFSFEYIIIVR